MSEWKTLIGLNRPEFKIKGLYVTKEEAEQQLALATAREASLVEAILRRGRATVAIDKLETGDFRKLNQEFRDAKKHLAEVTANPSPEAAKLLAIKAKAIEMVAVREKFDKDFPTMAPTAKFIPMPEHLLFALAQEVEGGQDAEECQDCGHYFTEKKEPGEGNGICESCTLVAETEGA